jgi:Na+-driven multidrug efflux pump
MFFLIAFIPTVTAPLVAKAAGGGDIDGARERVCAAVWIAQCPPSHCLRTLFSLWRMHCVRCDRCEAVWLAAVLGSLGMLLLVLFPSAALSIVLPPGAPAAAYARSYLSLRSLSLIPALISAVGFAAFRGLLDSVTPLKVSLASNTLK